MFSNKPPPMYSKTEKYAKNKPVYSHARNIFSVETKLPEGSFDWNEVLEMDPDEIKQKKDTKMMHYILNKFVGAKFSTSDMEIFQNPHITLRLMLLLQIVIEYLARTHMELQSMYGKSELSLNQEKIENGKSRQKIQKLSSALRTVKSSVKCPTCGNYYDSDLDLDRHMNLNHHPIYEAWSCVRENKVPDQIQKAQEMKREIENLRQIVRSLQKDQRKKKHSKEGKLTEQTEEPKIKYDPNKPMFDTSQYPSCKDEQKAVHPEDKQVPYLVIQDTPEVSISVKPSKPKKTIPQQQTEAALFLKRKQIKEIAPQQLEERMHKISEVVHKQSEIVEQRHTNKPVRQYVRKKMSKRLKKEVPEPPTSLRALLASVQKEFEYVPKEEEDIEEEEEEEINENEFEIQEEEEDVPQYSYSYSQPTIELTSDMYSSLITSSEMAEYYTSNGGGTTKAEQHGHHPRKRNKERLSESEKDEKTEIESSLSGFSGSSTPIKSDKKSKKKNNESFTSISSSGNSFDSSVSSSETQSNKSAKSENMIKTLKPKVTFEDQEIKVNPLTRPSTQLDVTKKKNKGKKKGKKKKKKTQTISDDGLALPDFDDNLVPKRKFGKKKKGKKSTKNNESDTQSEDIVASEADLPSFDDVADNYQEQSSSESSSKHDHDKKENSDSAPKKSKESTKEEDNKPSEQEEHHEEEKLAIEEEEEESINSFDQETTQAEPSQQNIDWDDTTSHSHIKTKNNQESNSWDETESVTHDMLNVPNDTDWDEESTDAQKETEPKDDNQNSFDE